MNQSDLSSAASAMSVAELAVRCRQESAAATERRDPRYCLELFRRAIAGRDAAAWSALYAQYQALVRHWLGRAPDPDDLVQETFLRFHRAATADRFTAGEFPTLGSVLAFLRTTAVNLLINERRRLERERRGLGMRWEPRGDDPNGENPEPGGGPSTASFDALGKGAAPDYLAGVAQQELADHIHSLVPDETEWLALRLSYEYDLPPREIARRCPQHFRDAAEVSRIKERVKKRLQNDARLRQYLED
jgi:RNA polymerase sigma factor (sigma-70 family)